MKAIAVDKETNKNYQNWNKICNCPFDPLNLLEEDLNKELRDKRDEERSKELYDQMSEYWKKKGEVVTGIFSLFY